MNQASHNKLAFFIWSIADDWLRDVYVLSKYRDVILPTVVLRRLDALLEPSKQDVSTEVEFQRNEMNLTELDEKPLQEAAGFVFFNTSKWTLSQLYKTATHNQQILLSNVEEYLNRYSENVKEIIIKFNLKPQVRHLAAKDVLPDVLAKSTSPYINLTHSEVDDPDGNHLPASTNLGMGCYIDAHSRKTESAADLLNKQVDKLREYRATLINSAVTGEVKVPGAEEPTAKTEEVA